MEDLIVWLIIFFVGVGVGTFVLGVRIRAIVAEEVKDYAEVAAKTKELIVAGVTRLEEIKKAL